VQSTSVEKYENFDSRYLEL